MAEISIMQRAVNLKGGLSYADFPQFSKQVYSSRTMNHDMCVAHKATWSRTSKIQDDVFALTQDDEPDLGAHPQLLLPLSPRARTHRDQSEMSARERSILDTASTR